MTLYISRSSSKGTKAGKATDNDSCVTDDEGEEEEGEGEVEVVVEQEGREGDSGDGVTQPVTVGADGVKSALMKKGLVPRGAGRGRGGGKVKKTLVLSLF